MKTDLSRLPSETSAAHLDRVEALGWDTTASRKVDRIGEAAARDEVARLKSEGLSGLALLEAFETAGVDK